MIVQNMYKYIQTPYREYLLAAILSITILIDFISKNSTYSGQISVFVLVVAVIGAIPITLNTISSLKSKRITIEVFNFFALCIALFLDNSIAAVWIELMLAFASYLEWKTKSRASNAVEELLNLAPEVAHMEVSDEQYKDISPESISVGDILLVKDGERVPVDGVIIFGSGVFDESSFTGESLPQEKKIGDGVFTATILSSGVVKIRATSVGQDTVLGRMVTLMREALVQKSNVHKFADRFATIFLPVVAIIAVIIFVTTKNSTMVAAFLLVICADDIAVAIPLAMEAALGKAAKRGVIVKGGINFERLSKAKTVVFDKTGTLTQAKFDIHSVEIAKGVPIRQFWNHVAIAEKFSEHPIGRAIYKEASRIVGNTQDPDTMEVLPGSGVYATFGSDKIVIGNMRAMEMYRVNLSSEVKDVSLHKGKTVLFVAVNGLYVGSIFVADSIKEDAPSAIKALSSLNIRTVMLTGDHEDVAQSIGNELGISEIIAGLTPEQKLEKITELSKSGIVVMVGDGVNDAPALARADVGIAMGKLGTAVAVEAADIIIQTDNLERVAEMIILSRTVRSVVIGNFIIWFITNALGTTLVLTRVAGIPLAAFFNFVSDFIPLLNSARLFRSKK